MQQTHNGNEYRNGTRNRYADLQGVAEMETPEKGVFRDIGDHKKGRRKND